MADEDRPTRDHPVISGVIALVAVALAVGLVLGGGALLASRVLLPSEGSTASDDGSSGGETMYLPSPSPTEADTDPSITLGPDPEAEGGPPSSKPAKPETKISLTSDASNVGSMERIYLRGTYSGGEGAILQVQQWEGGAWDIFPVTASVSNETFTTYIQTSQPGKNRFRVVDTDSGEASNEIRVTIG